MTGLPLRLPGLRRSLPGLPRSLGDALTSGVPAVVQPFAFQAETDAFASALAVAPTTARKRTIDRAIRRMKAAGIWAKAKAIIMIGDTDEASLRWWTDPAKTAIKVGAPTRSSIGWSSAGSSANRLRSGLLASELSQNDLGHYTWSNSLDVADSNSDYGVVDGSSNGISLAIQRTTDNNLGARCAGPVSTAVSNVGDSNGSGLNGVSRFDATGFVGSRNGVTKNTVASASMALPALEIFLLTINSNGSPGTPPARTTCSWYFGRALTNTQERELTGVIGEYLDATRFGEPTLEEVGVGSSVVTADCVAYGFTAQSITWVLQAARAGKSVAIVGGWRDRHSNIGGMSANGLCFTDFNTPSKIGGLSRWLIRRANDLASVADTSQIFFESRYFRRACLELLNPSKNGGYDIPLYETNGVVSVTKTGTVINSIKTTDGRTINGLQWFDGSYEGDLVRVSGCDYVIGREAAGTGIEALNGVDSTLVEYTGVNPWTIPNDTSSGLLPYINGISSSFTPGLNTVPAPGTADNLTQAYNFRWMMSNDVKRRVPLPNTPPPGYSEANYEWALRFMEANPSITGFADYFKSDEVSTNIFDVNNNGLLPSTDWPGYSWDYPLATYAQRESIWKAHYNYMLGLMYTMSYSTDPRVPAALQTSVRAYGFTQTHYFGHHENDNVFDTPQLYVREAIRMRGDAVTNGNDLNMTDGTAPRISNKTVSMVSYMVDSHSCRWIALEKTAGNWVAASEGGMGQSVGGTNLSSPVPLEIVVPKAAQITNLAVGFAISSTHAAFGAIRMELTAMQIGQTMGQAAAQAINDGSTIQAVNYTAVRSAVLASASLTNETAPVLDQVN